MPLLRVHKYHKVVGSNPELRCLWTESREHFCLRLSGNDSLSKEFVRWNCSRSRQRIYGERSREHMGFWQEVRWSGFSNLQQPVNGWLFGKQLAAKCGVVVNSWDQHGLNHTSARLHGTGIQVQCESRFNWKAGRLKSRSSYVDYYNGMGVVNSLRMQRQTTERINCKEYHASPIDW